MSNLKEKTISGLFYKFAERGASAGVTFLIQIILARLLLPEQFGTIALLAIIIAILNVFVTYGFGNSLIVNKNSDDLDFSTCFFFGIAVSLIIYLILFIFAPSISRFIFGNSELGILIKVMALRLPIAAINSVQHAYVSKNMRFKMFFYSTFIGTFLSGIISIAMAYSGFGVWALVAQYISNSFLSTLSLWIIAKWRPKLLFSLKRLKIIYDYGWKILAVGLLDTIFGQIRSIVIAKYYSRSDLAYYDRGVAFPNFSMGLIEPTIGSVLFPALSLCNDDRQMMKVITRRAIITSSYLVCGLLCFLIAISHSLVIVLLTEKWYNCIVFLQIGCLAIFFRPLQFINNCLIRASGRSGLLLKLDIIKKTIAVILLLVSMNWGVEAIAWSLVVTNCISAIINIYPNKNILNYSYLLQFQDLFSNLKIGVIVGVAVWLLDYLPFAPIAVLSLQIIVGFALFIAISILFKIESYYYLKNIVLSSKYSSLFQKNGKI